MKRRTSGSAVSRCITPARYADCRRQFESHRTVNPDDVENAAWHFLCVAREQGADKARAALLPVGPDPRAPMREVYQMFRGAMTAEDVLKAAGDRPSGQFYAHLYIGLYSEALGRKDLALKHIKEAASDRYAPVGGYMHMVATVHLKSETKSFWKMFDSRFVDPDFRFEIRVTPASRNTAAAARRRSRCLVCSARRKAVRG